nr:verticillium wilt disease resistance protein [Ipomoea batatas]
MKIPLLSWIPLISLLQIILGINIIVISGQCPNDQRSQLLQLRNSLKFKSGAPTNKLANWNESKDCCHWPGVKCDNLSRVIGLSLDNEAILKTLHHLDLSHNQDLSGGFPEFQQNGSLETVSLSYTGFSGSLPDSIGNLQNLSRIELSNCSFVGAIPSTMANLTSLAYVDFSFNNFIGPFPSFQKSKKLIYIDLSHNALTGPLFSSHFRGLSELKSVNLGSNLLSGQIPRDLFDLPSLQRLYLNDNHFGGQVTEFANAPASQLGTLDLSTNRLNGSIPKSFFKLPKLSVLSLSSNFFSGKMQFNVIEKLPDLRVLDLSYNNLTVDTTNSNEAMLSSPQLRVLNLASCKLIKFPDFRNQSKMERLDLSDNQIKGRIPNWIWQVGEGGLTLLNLSYNLLENLEEPYRINTSLTVIDLHSNRLQGNLPILSAFAVYVDYSDNNFSSVIRHEIGNSLVPAAFLSLSKNRLTGPIPGSICNSSWLQVLDLSQNLLSGKIPSCLMKLDSIVELDLGRNNFSGTISDTFPDGCRLKTLDLRRNILEGQMPGSLVNCILLQVLNVGNNKIVDKFPCFVRSSYTLRVLVLHSNQFFGELQCLTVNLSWPNLQIIDISSNNFTGKLDSTYFLNWREMTAVEDSLPPQENHIGYASQFNDFHYQDTVTVTLKGLQGNLPIPPASSIYVDYSDNNFSSVIPHEIGNSLAVAAFISLSNNTLKGKIPNSFCNSSWLQVLDLSQNLLSGKIPSCLMNSSSIVVLNLRRNNFDGTIPDEFPDSSALKTLDLSRNILAGCPLNRTCTPSPTSEPTPHNSVSTVNSDTDWLFTFIGLGFGLGMAVGIAPLWFSKQWRTWCDKQLRKLIKQIFPTYGFTYIRYNGARVVAEETIQEFTEDSDEIEDEEEDTEFHGRYCIFCSKLDIQRNNAIHDPKCTHHYCLPIAFSPTTPSSSSLSVTNSHDS